MVNVENLSKEFIIKKKGNKQVFTAVNDISFEVKKGEKVAFIGPNGAGKSTTIKMMTGIISKTCGEISVMGYNPQKERKELTKSIGCLFGQKSSLWMHLPAIDSFRLFGAIYDIDKKTLESRIQELTNLFDAKELINIPVKKLSLGQRMKLEILASMIHKPKILFLDEPTIGLDIIAKQKIREVINKINKEEETTIFLTSHDISDVEKLCDRIIIIDKGRVITDENISILKSKYIKTKTITIIYENDIKDINLEKFNVVELSDTSITVEVDIFKNKVTKIVEELMKLGNALDIKIEEMPLESIIENIYEGRGEIHVN